jgi:dTDP-4-dehydrorhamnose 3,5-epimerase-like enzyme
LNSRLEKCKFIEFPTLKDSRGNLTFIESDHHIPFNIKRVYYLTDVPFKGIRGGHAHKELHQIIIPIAGTFDIHIDDGTKQKTIQLNQDNKGLYICPLIWRELDNFSQGAVCLVLASDFYKEDDYFRDYNVFVDFILKLK